MKIGKSEKKHFCDKNLAALKGSTERDHQLWGRHKGLVKTAGIVFKRTTHQSGEVWYPEGEGTGPWRYKPLSRVLTGSWRSLGLDQVDRHWGNALQGSLTGRHRWPREAG